MRNRTIPGPLVCPHCERDVTERHFYASGKARCTNRLVWTPARRWRLMELLERGMTDEQIARRFGTTPEAVNLARKRHGIPSRTQTLLNCRTAAHLLGIGCAKAVRRWIAAGWLKGRRGPRRGGNRQWLITRRALMDYLEDPAHWHRWDPDRITDPLLRRWATTRRGDVRFLTVGQAAWRACVEGTTVNQWIHKGWLPARKNGNNWFIRDEDLEALLARRAVA